jgi:hypothetical protein
MAEGGWSADNIAFGMGGALLQRLDRDTQKFAFKCSSVTIDGRRREVFKDPVSDPAKRSKRGRTSASGSHFPWTRDRFDAMRTLLVAFVLAFAALAQAAAQEPDADFVISSGVEGGSYHGVASRLRTLLTSQYKYHVELLTSQGSLENLSRLDDPDSPVALALTQADALSRYLDAHPDFADEFSVLANVGEECAFLITGGDSGLSTTADLGGDEQRKISVGREGSGAAVTWEFLGRIDAGFRSTAPVHVDVMEALAQIKAGNEYSEVDVAMLVQNPRVLSPPLAIVLDNPDIYHFVSIRSEDLDTPSLPDGIPVYTFRDITVRKTTFQTLCTQGLLLAAKAKLTEDKRSRLAQVLLESGHYIAPGKR